MHVLFITGGLLIGVPILLHLIMRQEPKKLPFPALRFLKLKRKTNQRKMRLRHLILLLLRMGLIALIAWVLFQPRWGSDTFNIKGEQPVACVVVIDTSPSMGYVLTVDRDGLSSARKKGPALLDEQSAEDRKRPWTELDEARFRALELIDELPPGSKVAVIDTADRDAFWALAPADARKKIREIKRPRASSRSVTQTLPLAYQLFQKLSQEGVPGQENMPRLLCVLSDRTSASWDASQASFLKEMGEALQAGDAKKSPFVSTYIDVGVDKPLNLAIVGVEMKPRLAPANKPVEFSVLLEATGASRENTVQVWFDGERTPSLSQAVKVEPGAPKEITFRREGLAPGLHQAEIALATGDGLPPDDIRYLTFRVREPRKVLLVADGFPALGGLTGSLGMVGRVNDLTALWRISLESTAWHSCELATTRGLVERKPAQLADYEAIVLIGLLHPTTEVWERVGAYAESGGKVVVVPGADELLVDGRDRPPPGYDSRFLPGVFKRWIDVDRSEAGATWAWDALKSHGLLNDFREWQKNPLIDFVANRPRAWGYWEVEPRDKIAVVVSYADNANPDQRRPALLEREVGQTGRVLMFTTPMDGRFDARAGAFRSRAGFTNDYASSSFFLVLTNLALRYLGGDAEDAIYNSISGQNVFIKWPLDAASRSKTYYLSGPDVADKDAEIQRPENESLLRLGPDRVRAAGNYDLRSDPADKKKGLAPWKEGFSLNPGPEESRLERAPVSEIEELFGPRSVAASERERTIQQILGGKFDAPLELFPFLMILLLLFLAFENLMSNRFYAKPKQAEPTA
jgi:KaiC/GvpD/RAD55 family RecA-like ATPase